MASTQFICDKCHNSFASKWSLKRHYKQCSDSSFNEYHHKCLEGCGTSFKKCSVLKDHLKLEHNFSFQENQLEFASNEEFSIWLKKEEQTINIKFHKVRGAKRNKDGTEKYTLKCSRPGKKITVPEEISQGSSKLNFSCTSQITVRKHSTNKYVIHYTSTHYGHGEVIPQRRVTKRCRKKVAQKLLTDVSPTRSLDNVRNNLEDKLNKDYILTRQDISNTKQPLHINIQEWCRHIDDATSVDCWVKECQYLTNNPIRFYKKQGEENCNLKKNDFCLVYIDVAQLEIYTKFGSHIICVDGTHGLNSYDFELTTVLVLDEFGEGFPIAFMFANRRDTFIYELFFKYLKESITSEIIVPNIFMTDITNIYYNAWAAVMGNPKKHLYCSWHVDRAWQQNLSKVSNVEKRQWVYKTLKYLQMCLDKDTFEREFKLFLNKLNEDEETRNMHLYLMNNYTATSIKWAYCYRTGSGINTNRHFESMHKVIKYINLEWKKIKRLDKVINALLRYIRDKTLGRIIKKDEGQNNKHLLLINDKHRSATAHEARISQLTESMFEICENNDIYIVQKIKENVCCALACTYCNICIHCFECSCVEYAIRATICTHIHSVNIQMLPNDHTQRAWSIYSSEEVNNSTSEDLRYKVQTELTKLNNTFNSYNYSVEALTNLYHLLKTCNSLHLNSTNGNFIPVSVVNEQTHKNIEKQKCFSTRKKNNATKKLSKPNKSETKIIRETLNQCLIVSENPENDHSYVG